MLKVKVKVRHVPTAYILEIVKDKAELIIAIKYEITYGLLIDVFVFYVDPL